MHEIHLLSEIGTAIVAATVAALLARALKQPLILGYLVAGVVVGPAMGLGLVRDRASIEIISEIGLILLLFIIGLEMDLQKLMSAGRSLVLAGVLQFPLCVALGLGFALALGLPLGGGRFDAAYAAVAVALSSTMIVVKLLYDKHELMTQPGRLTLGILVFQDVWAILVLAVQPTLLDPSTAVLIGSLFKGALLVGVSMAASRYLLPALFEFIAKVPELLLVTALAWCFLVTGIAGSLGLSREMGALIAGVGMSTFPYNLDVIAKVVNIRDFFVTLFFVALGMQIPVPTTWAFSVAAAFSLFLVATRFLTIFPILYATRCGLRTSLLPAINLSQMSEFSLVIAALGLSLGHVAPPTVAVLTFVFVITSVVSTYMIQFNHELQDHLGRLARRLGLADPKARAEEEAGAAAAVVFLGFYRDASSIVHQFEMEAKIGENDGLLRRMLVMDFNPQVLEELRRRGIRSLYADVSSPETLHHAAVHDARIVVCTLTDSILKGTTNVRLLKQLRRLCPTSSLVVASETIEGALGLYAEGADFVFIPRIHSAYRMAEVIRTGLEDGLAVARAEEMAALRERDEVLA
ncbi:MAG TPA: cation:proton antiporter [Vicinamibacteria bacterium]|nr:cation:proton antiporter [Vicinamibacteria bacterium]